MKLVCAECGGENIKAKAWVDSNTAEFISDLSNSKDNLWCSDCKAHTDQISTHQYKTRKK